MRRNLVDHNNYRNLLLCFISRPAVQVTLISISIGIILISFLSIDSSTQNLIAHDEGLYARRAKLIIENNNWFNPFNEPHHKTVGSYWVTAFAYKFIGINEVSLRFPSLIFSILSLGMVFLIGKEVSSSLVGGLSSFLLLCMPLWIQYSRYVSPDMPFVFFSLLFLFSVIKTQIVVNQSENIFFWSIAGLSISIGFFLRSYMALLPLLSILPYFIVCIYKDGYKAFLSFIISFLIGLTPSIYSLFLSYEKFGIASLSILFDFAKNKSLSGTSLKGFYIVPLKILFFTYPASIVYFLISLSQRKFIIKSKFTYVLYYYPLFMLLILCFMSHNYSHYLLLLLPSFAITISHTLCSYYKSSNPLLKRYIVIYLTTISLFILMISSLFLVNAINFDNINKNVIYLIIISLFLSHFFSLLYMRITSRENSSYLFLILSFIMLPNYICINLLYNNGMMGNPNKDLKRFISNQAIRSFLISEDIGLYKISSKSETLLNYYLPNVKRVNSIEELNLKNYFITTNITFAESFLEANPKFYLIYKYKNNYFIGINYN